MNNLFFFWFVPPGLDTFADARDGDGDGGEGIILDHFGIILRPLWIYLRTILGPPMQKQTCVFQSKTTLLEMPHTNVFSSIRKTPYQLLIWTEKKENHVF